MGKSKVFADLRKSSQKTTEGQPHSVFWNLDSYGEEAPIREYVREQSIQEWRAGTGFLTLYIDSFDECQERLPHLGRVLLDLLRVLPLDRLKLRVFSRSTAWSNRLTQDLAALWNETQLLPYELLPLRRIDVLKAAELYGIHNPEDFLEFVITHQLQPLASKPITLDFLLASHNENIGLPKTISSVYEDGLRRLSEINDPQFRASAFSPRRHLLIASRIAGLLTFSGSHSVSFREPSPDTANGILSASHFEGGEESDGTMTVELRGGSIQSAITQGALFKATDGKYGFSHHTFQEFLTSRWLHTNKVGLGGLKLLMCDSDGSLFPQFHAVAGWVALYHPAFAAFVAHREPEVLVKGDMGGLDDALKARIANELLKRVNDGLLADTGIELWHHLYKLDYPELAELVNRWLLNKSHSIAARKLAILIARHCNLKSVAESVATVALDESDDYNLRSTAALALSKLGSQETRSRALPLARGEAGDDPDDELRGYGLRNCWPGIMSTGEMLACIVPEKRQSFYGGYAGFLHDLETVEHIPPQDMAEVLRWINAGLERHETRSHTSFSSFIGSLVAKALSLVANASIRRELALIVATCLKSHLRIPFTSTQSEESNFFSATASRLVERRLLISELIQLPPEQLEVKQFGWIFDGPFLMGEDIRWVSDNALDSQSPHASRWAELLFSFQGLGWWQVENEILLHRERLASRYPQYSFSTSTELDSHDATVARELYNQRRPRRPKKDDEPSIDLTRVLKQRLHGLAQDPVRAWPSIVETFNLDPSDPRMRGFWSYELEALPPWNNLEDDEHCHIKQAARIFVERYRPTPEEWVGTNHFLLADVAGVAALYLNLTSDRQVLLRMSCADWELWGLVILGSPDNRSERIAQNSLLAFAHAQCPEAIESALIRVIEIEDARGDHLNMFHRAKSLWNDRLSQSILRRLRLGGLRPSNHKHLLEDLLERKAEGAIAYTLELIAPDSSDDEARKTLSAIAAGLLLRFSPDHGWGQIRERIEKNDEWVRQSIHRGCPNPFSLGRWKLDAMSDEFAGELLQWLFANYHPDTDPQHDRGYTPDLNDDMRSWRGDVLSQLRSRGTVGARNALAALADRHPELPWLRINVAIAKRAIAERSCRFLKSQQVLNIVQQQKGYQVLRVLFVSANPEDSEGGRLAVDDECRWIEEKIQLSAARDRIKLQSAWAARGDDIVERLNRDRPHIFQFSGHGNEFGIELTKERGAVSFAPSHGLITLLATCSDSVKVVLLNSCYSAKIAEKLVEHVDFAIGMVTSISDEGARIFSAAFYRGLGSDRSIRNSFEQGLATLALEATGEEKTPVLFTKTGLDSANVYLVDIASTP